VKILDRYLAGAVIGGTLATLGVLLPLMGFLLLADEMDEIGENDYQFADALLFVLLIMLRYTYQIFPSRRSSVPSWAWAPWRVARSW